MGFSIQPYNPIGNIKSAALGSLNLSSNRFLGPLPLTIGHCSILDLSNNTLSGNFSRIQGWGNSLAGAFLKQTSQFLRLASLRISQNLVEGELPDVLGTYPELKHIDLNHNRFSGPPLPILFNSTKLTELSLSHNNFSGPLPIDENCTSSMNFSLPLLDLSGVVPKNLRRFPDSTFHPGNALLSFPTSPSSPKERPNLRFKDHGSH
ncbi:hypothetical protein SAY87_003742 [Trapa incisa]|uniref:Uncharacterized protein n=1 Tax=Trapa incisa TaxID=236973 RepID=A0AAN7QI96_9MYRT|nr:hypothetical protein SAY87_003742 [Trapa incisa]